MSKVTSRLFLSLLPVVLLCGCATRLPGGFSLLEQDDAAHSFEFRYKPSTLDQQALTDYVTQQCHQAGFDKADVMPEEDSALPGHKVRWFQCNYIVKD